MVNAALEVEEADGERTQITEARKRKDSQFQGNQNKKQHTHPNTSKSSNRK